MSTRGQCSAKNVPRWTWKLFLDLFLLFFFLHVNNKPPPAHKNSCRRLFLSKQRNRLHLLCQNRHQISPRSETADVSQVRRLWFTSLRRYRIILRRTRARALVWLGAGLTSRPEYKRQQKTEIKVCSLYLSFFLIF